ncbi:MAG: ATP-binding protein [Candidatus Kapabacteria bacterium]|nr:ATP-binding protein [Candidatus Kapabacteria bacterium]
MCAKTSLIGCCPKSTSGQTQGFEPPLRFHRTSWQTNDGELPHHSVIALQQTQDGYLWISTHEGLTRFDGRRFVTYNKLNTPQIIQNFFNKLTVDRKNRVWGEDIEQNILLYDNELFTRLPFDSAGAKASLHCTFIDTFSRFWVAKSNGLYLFTGIQRKKIGRPVGFPCDTITAIAQDSSGMLWFAGKGVLAAYNGTFRQTIYLPDAYRASFVHSLQCSADGTLWLVAKGNLLRWNHHSWQIVQEITDLADKIFCLDKQGRVWLKARNGLWFGLPGQWQSLTRSKGLLEENVQMLAEDNVGGMWIAYFNKGLQYLKNSDLQVYTLENGQLSNNSVRSLLVGREGEIWVGTNNGGLNRLRRGSLQMLDKWSGLPHEKVFPVMEARDGALWVGTSDGGVYRFFQGKVQNLSEKQGLGTSIARSLYEDKQGNIWVGTSGGGAHLINVRAWKIQESLQNRHGLTNNTVFSIIQDKRGTLWFGTEDGLYYRTAAPMHKSGNQGMKLHIKQITTKEGLSHNRVRCLALDSTGAILVGTAHGLNRIDTTGKITAYTDANGLPGTNRIFALYVAPDSTIWIGTFNSGLIRFKNGVFTHFTQAQGLFDDVVYAIAEDEQGRFWMSSNRGIYCVAKKVLEEFSTGGLPRITCNVFNKYDGMNDNECNSGSTPSVWRLRNGRLAFPTLGGVAFIQPTALIKNTLPPPVLIESVMSDTTQLLPSQERRFNEPLTITHTQNHLEIRFTATSLLVPEKVRCKYMLEGYDKQWIQAEERRVAYYANLPSGAYRFRVIARNNAEIWNDKGAQLELKILPPWWSSWWAWSVYISVGVSIAYVLLRYRDRQQRKILLTKQREREAEIIRQKNAELEEANAELRNLNEEKNEFLGIAAHDLKNPLGAINMFAEMLLNDDESITNEERRMYLETMKASSERMIALIGNLLDVNAIERGGFTVNTVHIPIAPFVLSLVDLYCASAEKKSLLLHCKIDVNSDTSVLADEQALMQVLDNLVSNAVKYSPQGKNIYIRLIPGINAIRVEIQDEGPGISSEDMKKLFGKFARLSARPTGGEHSTGLGLSIAKKMVEAMNGRVWCESELGKGATFIVELPCTPNTTLNKA